MTVYEPLSMTEPENLANMRSVRRPRERISIIETLSIRLFERRPKHYHRKKCPRETPSASTVTRAPLRLMGSDLSPATRWRPLFKYLQFTRNMMIFSTRPKIINSSLMISRIRRIRKYLGRLRIGASFHLSAKEPIGANLARAGFASSFFRPWLSENLSWLRALVRPKLGPSRHR